MIRISDRVRFVETDLMGVVHHTNYLRWFEMARVEYLRAGGIDLNIMKEAGYLFPITDVQCKYKNSARFDDEYEVSAVLTEFSRAKLVFSYQVTRKTDGLIFVEGTSQNVFMNLDGKIARIPESYFSKINALFAKEKGNKEKC